MNWWIEMLQGLERKRLLREFMWEAVSGDPIPRLIRAHIGAGPEIDVEILPDPAYPGYSPRILFRRGLGAHGEDWDAGTLRQAGRTNHIATDLGAREWATTL